MEPIAAIQVLLFANGELRVETKGGAPKTQIEWMIAKAHHMIYSAPDKPAAEKPVIQLASAMPTLPNGR